MSATSAKPPRLPAMAQNYGLLASPPPLRVVVARTFVSCALAMRAQIDRHADAGAALAITMLTRAWLAEHRFDAALDAEEATALAAPPGSLDATSLERFTLLGEALGVFAWALRRQPLPPPDQAIDAADTAAALGFLHADGAALATGARLRDREATARYADIAGALHWRARNQIVAPGSIVMSRWRSDAHEWPEDVTAAQFVDADLAAHGRAITSLGNDELLPLLQRCAERHRAALWLLGQQRDYWQVAAQL